MLYPPNAQRGKLSGDSQPGGSIQAFAYIEIHLFSTQQAHFY